MAEINEAYASMTRGDYRPGGGSAGRWAAGGTEGAEADARRPVVAVRPSHGPPGP